ncbi:hypothetical protein AVEN_126408-1 [Araneus ventricosus]|uniref:Uncharacterized protein n=1 Tax=Araneus ventricosus TaxID=182803 RepID=A0A4Y2GJW6_ARAVE|nr:hypothetical protein AVEN_126408-1 [Araneus ventricosus]
MAKCRTFAIWFLLAFSFFLSVNSQKTGVELSSAGERIPRKIFMKDEPRRQDSNEKSLRDMHLCMEEEDRKDLLITCDRRYSSKFACVGAWEGNIEKCDEFEEKQVAAAICVQAESSYVSICEYKNLKSSYLCSPRKLAWTSDYKEYPNSEKVSTGLREGIRPCNNKKRRICLEKGALLPCGDIGQLESKVEETDKKIVINTSRQENSENRMSYKSIKSEIDKPLFRDGIQNLSYHTSIIPNKGTNNHILKYKTVNILSPPAGVSKFLNPQERLFAFESDTEKKESSVGDKSRFDIPIVSYPLSVAPAKVQVDSKLKYKTVTGSEFSDLFENVYTLESSTDFEEFRSGETESRFRSANPYMPYHTSVISDKGNINPKIKYKKVNILSPQRGVSKFSNLEGNIYDLESDIDKTESISGERESRFLSAMENLPIHKSIVSNRDQNKRKLKYKTVNMLPPQRGISEVPNPKDSVAAVQTSKDRTGYTSDEIKPFEEEKEFSSSKTESVIDEAEHNIKEPGFVTDGFEAPIGLNTDKLEQKYKIAASTIEESMESSSIYSASMKEQWESKKPEWKLAMTEQPEKRPVVPEHNLKEAERAPAQPAHTYGALFRAPIKRRPVEATTEQSSQTKSFFYVLKCKDCDIQHVMLVDEDAEDVIPEVETWTFKT